MPVTLALQIGTGGLSTKEYGRRLYDYSAALSGYYRPVNDAPRSVQQQNAASDISRILEILKPSISGLAKYLGVSRTAIYDWIGGKQIGESTRQSWRILRRRPK